MQNLDFKTACVIYLCSNICIATLLIMAFSDSRARGFGLWIAGLCTQILAAPLFALRGSISDMASIVVANTLFASSWSLYWASFDVFFGNRRPCWIYGLPVLLAVCIFTVFLHDAVPRALLGASLFAVQAWMIGGIIFKRRREFRRYITAMLAVGYGMAGLSFLVRILTVVTSADANPNPFAPSLAQDVAMLLSVPGLIGCTLGFVLLHRERDELEVRCLADTDHLTGLLNRRGFETLFNATLHQGGEGWSSLAVIDIDHFKAVNDRYGHGVGDKVLVELARIFSREVREGDGVARVGGDEFSVLLARTGPERAAFVAERLRRAVSSHDWRPLGLETPLTVTIGLASHQGQSDDGGPDVVQLADMALLAAKNLTRNMVLHADTLDRDGIEAGA